MRDDEKPPLQLASRTRKLICGPWQYRQEECDREGRSRPVSCIVLNRNVYKSQQKVLIYNTSDLVRDIPSRATCRLIRGGRADFLYAMCLDWKCKRSRVVLRKRTTCEER